MWKKIADRRWEWTADQERHFLLHTGDQLVEFHHHTVHVFAAPDPVDDDQPTFDGDGQPAVWQSSDERPDLTDASDTAVWTAMAGHGKVG